ncbi:MAG: CHAT domain-containing protein [Okeania sp. SIO2C9]|uniref:CHAT domain-containing protein n=1 Tax=Okeania sp. SIO2C9 TaxID=2607791 RepID=UPI0013C0B22D|nr:CHAT domain-containing protein [Okeania sp. SIO2C9]
MKTFRVAYYPLSLLIPLLPIVVATPGKAQPITPANDGTGTTVNQNGNQFNIQGGTRSGRNLFHSFDQFNVNSGQTANFLTTPDTRNILGRVTGGNASIINGLIQVIGSNSNLLLMNPAGMIFGPNATLNLPASFSVTTATGIGFNSNNFWFQAIGTNDYSNLVGNPSGYRFNVSNPGAIVNEGNLSLNPGENLTLLGGTVINTGELSTAGGNVTIAAVEGGSTLRISQPGHLLSLDVSSSVGITEETNFTPLSLPELLTGGDETHATSMSINADGDVVLIDANTLVADTPGDVLASGNIDVSTLPSYLYEEGNNNLGGQINVLGDRVAIIDANIHADGINGGGTVLIGGDFQGNGIVSNSQQTFVNNNSFISADAIINGDGGRVIIWSDGVTNFAGNISAKGGDFSGNGGFVEVSGKQELIFDGNVNVSAAFGTQGTILLDPENITVGESENTENSETETVDNNSEVASTENTDSSTTENTENSETETVDNNSEVASAESTDSPTTENTENSETETVDNNSEVASAESTEENVDNSETTENTNSETEVTSTEIADNSETTETEIPIDPFAQDKNSDVTISAENIGELSGDIILFADNDITINEKIETDSSVELKAGRSININADIDTSIGNGNIDLLGNNDEMNFANRSEGKASINQLDGTTLNAGSGTINIQLGNLGEVGDINLANLTTTGQVLVNANGGNIARVSDNSIINAGSVLFETNGNGGIGLAGAPLRLEVGNLEAVSGSGGVFFDVGNVNIGGVSEDVDGIKTIDGGDIILDSRGDVTVTEDISADVVTDGETGGDINIAAKNLSVIDGTEISASTLAKGDAGSVEIHATDTVVFDGGNSDSFTGVVSGVAEGAEGNAGDVTITTRSLEVKNGAQILANTFGNGNAGNVEIHATETVVLEGEDSEGTPSAASSTVAEGAKGNGGTVTITTGSLEVKNGADVSAEVEEGAEGNGGDVIITTRSLEVKNEGKIFASNLGTGNAGTVEINATDTVVLDGKDSEYPTGVISSVEEGTEGNRGGVTITTGSLEVKNGAEISSDTYSTGNGGGVTITTGSLEVKNGAQVSASTFGNGNAGTVEIHATETVVLEGEDSEGLTGVTSSVEEGAEGNAGSVTITTRSLEVKNGAQILANTFGNGNAGAVEIHATETVVLEGEDSEGTPSAASSTVAGEAKGDGGSVTITTRSLEVKNGADVSAEVEPRAEGNGGKVTINTRSLEVKNEGEIFATTEGKGNAGTVEINATETVVLDGGGGDPEGLTGVTSRVEKTAEGDAGGVTITTGSLEVKNGAQISASTRGQGNAGKINITADDTVVFDGVSPHGTLGGAFSEVELGAEGDVEGISISTGSLKVTNGAQISTSTRGQGDAGKINITAEDSVVFDRENEFGLPGTAFSQVRQGAKGNAGGVTIETGSLTVTNGALISASTRGQGDAGSINITAEETVVFDGSIQEPFIIISGAYSTVEGTAEGDAGGVIITTGSLEVTNGAQISASTFSKGNAGSVDITAKGTVVFDGESDFGFSSGAYSTVEVTAEGNAGGVRITTGSLEVTNVAVIDASTLGTGNAGTIDITAKDTVVIDGISPDGFPSGVFSRVGEEAEGKAGDVSITTDSLAVTNGAVIDASTLGQGSAGNIFITTDTQLTLNENAQISAFTESSGTGGNIILFAPETLNITGNGQITVRSSGAGNAGQIDILSPNITLSGGIDITAFTAGPGNAGNINLEGDQINIQPNTQILAFTETTGDGGNITVKATEILNLEAETQLSVETNRGGKAGNIEITTPQLTIGKDAQISATVNLGATTTDPGGNITINTNELNISGELGIFAETEATADAGTLTLNPYKTDPNLEITFTNNGFISASTSSTGNGGNINLSAPESINIIGDGSISVETTDEGNAGAININTQNLTLSDGVAISASTEDKGNAGAININTQNFTLETGTTLTTETNNKGQAGNIEINTRQLTIGENAQISATAREGATNTEAGGNITINATDLLISGRLGIFAETAGETPAGTLTLKPYNRDGGKGRWGDGEMGRWGDGEMGRRENYSARIDPNLNITFTENGFISARTTSSGDGGNINIFAPENINITGEGRITVETEGSGDAGIINIETEHLTIAENTTISAATSDSGDGGRINITPSETFQLEGQIITETTGTGNGGKITINTGSLQAENSTISAKSTDAGNAGAIEITAQENIATGIIQSSASESQETADGGNISIISEQGEIDATQPIQSFSEKGNAGDVTLQAKTDITTNTISSHGQQQGGQITITTETGNVNTSQGFLANYSGDGNGGNVTIEAPQGDITSSNIYSFADADGGQIFLKAGGDINIRQNSDIISASEPPDNSDINNQGQGGDIILEAGNNINTATARIYSGADIGDTGKIDIIADSAIEVGQIDLASGFVRQQQPVNDNFTLIPIPQGEATRGVAENITITSNNGAIDTTAGVINSRSPDGSGDITLNARDNITIGLLRASALNPEKPTTGGDITIASQTGEINATTAIETFSERGTAGNVTIMAEEHIHLENILSQGAEGGGDITIESRSENSIDAQGELNTFSTEGMAGNVTLTSPGNISISGIRSQGREQGGNVTVESEIGEINSTGNIDSFSEQGRGGNIDLNAPESVNLANVSSFGATESGNLRIQSRTATVNTGNVTTQAPAGSSGSIVINGEEVGTGDLTSIGTTSAGAINVEATDGSITTYDIEISSDGTIGNLILRATEDVNTGGISQDTGDGDANINIDSGGDQDIEEINQNADGDATNIAIAEGNQTIGDINQNAGDDATNIAIAEGNQTIGDINQNAGDDATNIAIAEGNQTIGDINQNAGDDATNIAIAEGNQTIGNATPNTSNESINIQNDGTNQNIGNVTPNTSNESINIQNDGTNQNIAEISASPNDNTPINNPLIDGENTNNSNNSNTPTNSLDTNSPEIPSTSNLISNITPSNNDQTTNTGTAKEQTEESINKTTDTKKILNIIDTINTNTLTVATGSEKIVTMLEQQRINEYSDYFGEDFDEKLLSTQNVRNILTDIANQTGKESAVVYINAYSDQLQIILFTKEGQPILKTISTANREKLKLATIELMLEITDKKQRKTTSYLAASQQLYQLLIAPIATELEAANIDTILFSLDVGFRLLPLAALHDGEQFLIEKYSISSIPSVSLMDSRYSSVHNTTLLAMGASEFTKQAPLFAVPVELETISQNLWQGNMFLNEEFTLKNLINQRQNYPYPIIHLATHAKFNGGNISNSYIQLWNEKLRLNQVRKLGWSQPPVELLVLSACQTAVGNKEAELGFAGFAVATGVKSVLASLWLVSDEGTLGLMTEFYSHLGNLNIKAEVLRQTQLAMLRGEVAIEDGILRGSGSRGEVPLPPELAHQKNQNFSHPYYWAGFTMVGSPW